MPPARLKPLNVTYKSFSIDLPAECPALGEVEYLEDPLDEPDAGCVLICCSKPKSSLVIEV